MIDRAGAGDVISCDPTYSDVTKSHFDRYGTVIFGWEDQVRLAQAVLRAADRAAVAIISNGAYHAVAELYPSSYRMRRTRKKAIGRARCRGTDDEFLFVVDPLGREVLWSHLGEIENHFITHISEDWTPSAQAKRVTY